MVKQFTLEMTATLAAARSLEVALELTITAFVLFHSGQTLETEKGSPKGRWRLRACPRSPSPLYSGERGWGEGVTFLRDCCPLPLSPEYGGEGSLWDRFFALTALRCQRRIIENGLFLRFRDQFLDGFFEFGAANVLVANHALGVEDVNRGEEADVPVLKDATRLAIPPMRPRHRGILDKLRQRVLFRIRADANEGKRLVLELLDHLAFVRNHGSAWRTPGGPDVEYDHLALVVLELNLLAVQVLALHVRSRLANR